MGIPVVEDVYLDNTITNTPPDGNYLQLPTCYPNEVLVVSGNLTTRCDSNTNETIMVDGTTEATSDYYWAKEEIPMGLETASLIFLGATVGLLLLLGAAKGVSQVLGEENISPIGSAIGGASLVASGVLGIMGFGLSVACFPIFRFIVGGIALLVVGCFGVRVLKGLYKTIVDNIKSSLRGDNELK